MGTASATVIGSDAEALEMARQLVDELEAEAAERDAQRALPHAQVARVAASGLLAITVPRALGGADVSHRTLAEVVRLLATADANVAQIPHSHFVYVNVLRRCAGAQQWGVFADELLAGGLFGNAQAEVGIPRPTEVRTRLEPAAGGEYRLNGVKRYCTGALFADWVTVLAKGPDELLHAAYVRAGTPGLSVLDDWEGMGQRCTASGTVELRDVAVAAEHVVPYHLIFSGPQLHGALAQLLHAAIDTGIARAALDDAGAFVRERGHPWWESGVQRACEDPLVIQRFGELAVQVRAAEALLAAGADALDGAAAALDERSSAAASIAVAAAKAFVDRVSVEAGSALFELAGAGATRERDNLSRHWRNARTHTLHDPVRWKVHHIGSYELNGTAPPSTAHI